MLFGPAEIVVWLVLMVGEEGCESAGNFLRVLRPPVTDKEISNKDRNPAMRWQTGRIPSKEEFKRHRARLC
jgi:hypothetical protein